MLENIEKHGLQVNYVLADEDGPAFAYSVGLWHSYKHAEILIFGLEYDTALAIINDIAQWLKDGNPAIETDQPNSNFLEGYDCFFCEVPKSKYEEYVLSCQWLYQGNSFPLFQLIWPSEDGSLPWNETATPSFREMQPVIGSYQEAN